MCHFGFPPLLYQLIFSCACTCKRAPSMTLSRSFLRFLLSFLSHRPSFMCIYTYLEVPNTTLHLLWRCFPHYFLPPFWGSSPPVSFHPHARVSTHHFITPFPHCQHPPPVLSHIFLCLRASVRIEWCPLDPTLRLLCAAPLAHSCLVSYTLL